MLSSFFPSVELLFFFLRHGSCRDRETFSIGKLDHNTKKISPSTGLSEDVINRVLASRFGAPHPCIPETYFINFFRLHLVSGDMIDTVLRPKQLIDQHGIESTMASNYEQVRVKHVKRLGVTIPPNVLVRADRVIR